MIRIRAFRATDDPNACKKFIAGHEHVLEVHGVKKVTSANHEWMFNPGAFVIIVESENGDRVLGGARIHAAGGTQPLPIETATGEMDPKIYSLVDDLSDFGTGELCGLWNSREVAGLGIGAFFATRAGVVISEQIGLGSIFALCAPYTVKFAQRVGCKIIHTLGNNGTFYYPKIDLLATAVLLEDAHELSTADPNERERILNLRKNPQQVFTETVPIRNQTIEIQYDLALRNVNVNEFRRVSLER